MLCIGVDRRGNLELILPRAKLFQERVDSLQQWLISVEQDLAELRNAEREMLHLPEGTEEAKVGHHLCIRFFCMQTYTLCHILHVYIPVEAGGRRNHLTQNG